VNKNLDIAIHEYLDAYTLYIKIYDFTMSNTHMNNTQRNGNSLTIFPVISYEIIVL
jgi:hypothetical protein